MKLNELQPAKGSVHDRTRVGRGIGSGKGKTCGRGHKGQKARSGVAIKGYEGGQMPLYRRLPKRGFNNPFAKKIVNVTLRQIQNAFDKKQLESKKPVTEDALVEARVVRRKGDGIKLLAKGELTTKADIQLTAASKGAEDAVKKAGGSFKAVTPAKKPARKEAAGSQKTTASSKKTAKKSK